MANPNLQTRESLQAGELVGTKRLKLACNLTEFPLEILELADTLEILDLSGNQLSTLPDEFSLLKNLKIAFFSDNNFTEFPAVLAKCPQLEMVGFKACQISHIPEEALSPHLRWLILTNNQITELPKSIGKCHRMQKLMLAGNKLTHLPEEIAACHNLELFRISANQLTELPDWLFSMPRLSWLAFAGNPFSQVTVTQTDLPEIAWGNLEINELLGEGASGLIYKAHVKSPGDKDTSTAVAVKVFKGEVTSDGLPQDEMRVCTAAGEHPNLVRVLGKITDHPEQKQGLVLGLIPPTYKNLGGPPSFETCTRDTFPHAPIFSLQEVFTIASGMASVAAHLHARGINHGDLYAHNTLIDEEAHPLFGDFGAGALYDTASPQAAAIQRLEVRAYGYLLDDLLNHLNPEDYNQRSTSVLHQLKEDCLQEAVLQRPDFASILHQLTQVEKQ